MDPVVECVPNFSVGRDRATIDAIVAAIASVRGVVVMGVDIGVGANRTVVTFAGDPEAVEEGALRGIAEATARIDMRTHTGVHARMGATDVCPFVPVRDVTMDACVRMAERVGARVGEELGVPVYLYAEAARRPERRRLPDIRRGQYEGLPAKMSRKAWAPDFGAPVFNAKSGATAIGARPFLIAWNVNLSGADAAVAKRIARRLRESGEWVDQDGKRILRKGRFKGLQGDGWVIPEYRRAQVTFNVLDHRKAPLHAVYQACQELADVEAVAVTGSEIVGMVPMDALRRAGDFYAGDDDSDWIAAAAKGLGLDDLSPFIAEERVFEMAFEARRGHAGGGRD